MGLAGVFCPAARLDEPNSRPSPQLGLERSDIDEVYRESLATQIALSEVMNRLRLTVTSVPCIHGAKTPQFDHVVGGVRLLAAKQLQSLVEAAASILTGSEVQEIATLAERTLRWMFSWER